MLSSANIKLINSLCQKKYRDRNKLFVIEGDKLVREFLESGKPVKLLLAMDEWIKKTDKELLSSVNEIITVNERELAKVSQLKTPQNTLALVDIEKHTPEKKSITGSLSIALDNIQDPGNLGTIIRIAAWFGIDNILCSKGTVDVYNPKTIQASMGALLHVKVSYTDLAVLIPDLVKAGTPVYAASLDGEPVQDIEKKNYGLLLFGNESKGISGELMRHVSHKIIIPPFKEVLPGIESLNVAISAAIICNEFRRDSR
ncbi:MAG: RNA methyltransferase [Bacteroidota bacterium]|nr:RNA methyltransferase [Bacteroidota bacterium]